MTPPPAGSLAAMIRPAPIPDDSKINQDILYVMKGTSLGYWLLLSIALTFVGIGAAVWLWQIYEGLGIAGYIHPVFWGAYIVTFVFWVGIAHAGTLISAILYLFRAKWRNAINRSAEAMTVFAVMTAGLFLGIHLAVSLFNSPEMSSPSIDFKNASFSTTWAFTEMTACEPTTASIKVPSISRGEASR